LKKAKEKSKTAKALQPERDVFGARVRGGFGL